MRYFDFVKLQRSIYIMLTADLVVPFDMMGHICRGTYVTCSVEMRRFWVMCETEVQPKRFFFYFDLEIFAKV